jgi:class 3 adenylate cyclase
MDPQAVEQAWGQGRGVALFAPSHAGDPEFTKWMAKFERQGASPAAAVALMQMNSQIDVTGVLPAIRTPTIVMHRTGDRVVPVEAGRQLSEGIAGSRFVEVAGDDHMPYVGDTDLVADEIEEFLTGVRPVPEADRILATILFTDIVDSTATTSEIGDKRWAELLDGYYSSARKELDRFRGREVKTTGDGLLATFDGPARGIRCAAAVRDAAQSLGIETRSGLHTGECEVMGDDIAGIAVDIGARVSSEAGTGDVLVSSTVRDLVAGSGLEFEDRGARPLKGVPGDWQLFAVTGGV